MDKTEQSKKKQPHYSWFLRRQVAVSYIEDNTKTLQQLSDFYGVPHQTISRWARDYASDQNKRTTDRTLSVDMTNEEQKHYELLRQENDLLKKQLVSLQSGQLKSENEQLKEELEFTRMKARAMEIIIELAKEEYGIDVTKNSGARQPASSGKTTRRQK